MWAATRICQASFKPVFKSTVPVLKTTFTVNSIEFVNATPVTRQQPIRKLANFRSQKVSHVIRRSKSPETAFTIGKGIVAGAAATGIGALCFYGLGLSQQQGIVERSALWPQYVRDRIRTTFLYVGESIVVAVIAASMTLKSPTLLRIFASGKILPNLLLTGTLIASSVIVQSVPYSPGFGAKQLSWLAFSALVGAMIAPISFYGGQVLIRAAWYTSGIVGGLSTIAICAPSEQFLKMGGVLAIGCGVVFASGIGTIFLPPTTGLGASMYSIFFYGGLLLFSGLLMHNTQRIVKEAESLPPDHFGGRRYDPINMSMMIFMDVVNIFMRLVVMVGGSSKNR